DLARARRRLRPFDGHEDLGTAGPRDFDGNHRWNVAAAVAGSIRSDARATPAPSPTVRTPHSGWTGAIHRPSRARAAAINRSTEISVRLTRMYSSFNRGRLNAAVNNRWARAVAPAAAPIPSATNAHSVRGPGTVSLMDQA